MSDEIKTLPVDKSEVPKSHLEMLDIIFKNETQTKTIIEKIKLGFIWTGVFCVLNTQFLESLIKKVSGSSEVLLWKSIIFFILVLFFLK